MWSNVAMTDEAIRKWYADHGVPPSDDESAGDWYDDRNKLSEYQDETGTPDLLEVWEATPEPGKSRERLSVENRIRAAVHDVRHSFTRTEELIYHFRYELDPPRTMTEVAVIGCLTKQAISKAEQRLLAKIKAVLS